MGLEDKTDGTDEVSKPRCRSATPSNGRTGHRPEKRHGQDRERDGTDDPTIRPSDTSGPDVADAAVLHVVTGDDWGGAPRVAELLATGTTANTAIACAPTPRLVRRFEARGVPVITQRHLRSPPAPTRDVRAIVGLCATLRRSSFDLVHCHSTKAGILGRVAGVLTNTPTVFSVHGWGFYNTEYDRLTPLLTGGERVLARVTDAIVCVSENDLTEGQRRGIVEKSSAWVVHNGIPPVEFPEGRTRLSETGVDTEKPVVGTVGRLVEQKQPMELFRAGRDLRERGHELSTLWIGGGVLEDRCRRALERDEIDGHLLGFRKDAFSLAADFEVMVLPSKFEGFPVSVLEAMSIGLPVVAYDVGGVSESVVDGETGFVVPPDDRETLVDPIEELISNPELATRMGESGRRRVTEEFSTRGMVEKYERVYRRVLERASYQV